ncbi:type II toxin-antitoxin system RelE/ParE family toxin [Citromicrobium bathyomarinum]|uniref:type II toxin-antitoxin system RelE/ParE family toxin n=1 Tax=unclassified Citromicrobium TaxID=2630544 RepID=UPI0006C91179|nr:MULTISPECIES: type II toxin-antitoxin system RelE/ParE family toxin [unclassified Citromicrobium]KPM25231.1 hypothetical protein AAJ72_06025 [Citromicrobium sp. RCC1885]KPM28472.1 hypothetical protein AAJ74_06765 [Citromicrobium sp. RCC1878]MAO05008.1 type II toxin-antitoxin system RelE/ParE family toxin [Citromicrobium sp.]OAM09989.1 hypothetical protein A0U43_02645 [Citromicrobium sp. RCC1897]
MIVAFSPRSARDLEALADYIARDNPQRALSFIAELRDACMGLAEFPDRFPLSRVGREGTRQRIFGQYAIIYRVEGQTVRILQVIHAARLA